MPEYMYVIPLPGLKWTEILKWKGLKSQAPLYI